MIDVKELLKKYGYESYYDYVSKKGENYFNYCDFHDLFVEAIDTFIKIYPNYKILDIGCSAGTWLKGFGKLVKNPSVQLYGIEYDENFYKNSPYKNDMIYIIDEAINLDLHIPDNFIDFAYSHQVFEHFPSLEYSLAVLKKLYSVMKPNSFFFLSLVWGKHETAEELIEKYKKGEDVDITHINIYPYEVWKDLIREAGFYDVSVIFRLPILLYRRNRNEECLFRRFKWHCFVLYKPSNQKYILSGKIRQVREIFERVCENGKIDYYAPEEGYKDLYPIDVIYWWKKILLCYLCDEND